MANPHPELAVLLTLTDLRGEVAEHLGTWTSAQTLARDRYQVVLASDGDVEVERQAEPLLAPQDELVRAPGASFVELYNAALERASAPWILVSEAHCLAEPDCLERTLAALAADPELAAAALGSFHIVEGPDEKLGARWMEGLIEGWKREEEWPRFGFAGFVITRDALERAGGLEPRYGLFATYALAARLHSSGAKVGGIDDARVGHVAESVRDHHESTAKFTRGECVARAELEQDYCERYFGFDPVFSDPLLRQPAAARRLALALAHETARAAVARRSDLRWTAREFARALSALAGLAGTLDRVAIRASELVIGRLGRTSRVPWRLFLDAQDRMVRLTRIRAARRLGAGQALPRRKTGRWSAEDLGGELLGGAHGLERDAAGRAFRWTQPLTLLRLAPPPGDHVIRVDTGGMRGSPLASVAAVYAGATRVPREALSERAGVLELRLPAPLVEQSANVGLALLTRPLVPARNGSTDPRRLGLPVLSVEMEPDS